MPELHLFARTGSTNDVLRRRAGEGAASGTTAVADLQTAGRGQHGRTWEAGAGASLLMSVLVRTAAAEALGAAPVRVGLVTARAIQELTGLETRVKWPNDVLVGERKIAGVLCEAATTGTSGETAVIVGIGVNVSQDASAFSPAVAHLATSLHMSGRPHVRRGLLAGAILRAIDPTAGRIADVLDERELRAFAERDVLRGHPVAIDGQPAGVAAGITPHGELRVQSAAGVVHVHTGSVRIAGARDVAHERAQ